VTLLGVFGVAAGGAALLGVTKAITGSWSPYLPMAPISSTMIVLVALTASAILSPTVTILRGLDRRTP
jgi:hypothetical protein